MKDYSRETKRPDRSAINQGLTFCRASTLHQLFGTPGRKTVNCSPLTNASLQSQIETRNVGPIKARGLKLLLDHLEIIFSEIRADNRDLYNQVTYYGMLCCRKIRGGSNFSNHSWGSAIDLSFGTDLDARGDSRTQIGLAEIYPYFHKRGWYWGAGFSTEDSMHFESSDELIRRLYRGGIARPEELDGFRAPPVEADQAPGPVVMGSPTLSPTLNGNTELEMVSKGLRILRRGVARCEAVGIFQDGLNSLDTADFSIDLGPGDRYRGFFGPKTESAVRAFQASSGLSVDGIVGEDTLGALNLLIGDHGAAPEPSLLPLGGAASPALALPVGGSVPSNDYDPPQESLAALGSIPVAQGRELPEVFQTACEAILEITKDDLTAVLIDSAMATDADGSPRAREIDPRWGQLQTSYNFRGQTGQAKYPDAEKIRYYVLPGNNKPVSNRFYKKIDAKLGDVAAVIYEGQVSFAMFADVGPPKKIGEGSIALSESFGFDPWGIRDGKRIIVRGITNSVIYIVFPGSSAQLPRLTPRNANREVTKLGKKLFKELGGKLP